MASVESNVINLIGFSGRSIKPNLEWNSGYGITCIRMHLPTGLTAVQLFREQEALSRGVSTPR